MFVHVLDEHGGISAQADAPVAYATSMWDPGEQIVDRREVAGLPAARAVRIGLYDPITGQRLAAAGADGAPLEENAVTLTK